MFVAPLPVIVLFPAVRFREIVRFLVVFLKVPAVRLIFLLVPLVRIVVGLILIAPVLLVGLSSVPLITLLRGESAGEYQGSRESNYLDGLTELFHSFDEAIGPPLP